MTNNPGVKRKVVKAGGSLVVTIPNQLAAISGIVEGDRVEFHPLGAGELRFKKVEPE